MTYDFREGFKQIKRDDLVKDYDALNKSFKETGQKIEEERGKNENW